jgi:hypothetical protein
MRALFLSLFLGMMLATGCKTGKVCDARGDMPDQCEIHNRIMRSEKFPNPHRTDPPPREYLAARYRYFRHAKPILIGLPDDCKEVMVYMCDDCVRAEEQWKAAHPGLAP